MWFDLSCLISRLARLLDVTLVLIVDTAEAVEYQLYCLLMRFVSCIPFTCQQASSDVVCSITRQCCQETVTKQQAVGIGDREEQPDRSNVQCLAVNT